MESGLEKREDKLNDSTENPFGSIPDTVLSDDIARRMKIIKLEDNLNQLI